MSSVASTDPAESLARRRAMNAITDATREMAVVMTLLNLRVGEQVGLRDVEMKALDVLVRDGAKSAKALGQRLGMHPATMTGILDKLEKGGWVTRERDPDDRRAVLIQPVREKAGEIARLFVGMNTRMTELLARYDLPQLQTIADFITSTTAAAKETAAEWERL